MDSTRRNKRERERERERERDGEKRGSAMFLIFMYNNL